VKHMSPADIGELSNGSVTTEALQAMLAEATIQLEDGKMFAPFAPHPEAFTLENISTGLSNCCRYGMQIKPFYSVAQHSVLVAALCENDIKVQKFALLHDAEEGFGLPDIPTPFKPFLKSLIDAQHHMSRMIFKRYGLSASLKKRVKPQDIVALAMEKRDLKKSAKEYLTDLPAAPIDIFIHSLQPTEAGKLFDSAVDRVFVQGQPITKEWILAGPGFSSEPMENAA